MLDLCKEERFHRRASILDAGSDLKGGHHVYVDGEENGKYTAYCTPYEEGCWFGPERGCATEALDDGRHHHAGHESEPNPWWQQLEALRGISYSLDSRHGTRLSPRVAR